MAIIFTEPTRYTELEPGTYDVTIHRVKTTQTRDGRKLYVFVCEVCEPLTGTSEVGTVFSILVSESQPGRLMQLAKAAGVKPKKTGEKTPDGRELMMIDENDFLNAIVRIDARKMDINGRVITTYLNFRSPTDPKAMREEDEALFEFPPRDDPKHEPGEGWDQPIAHDPKPAQAKPSAQEPQATSPREPAAPEPFPQQASNPLIVRRRRRIIGEEA